MENILLTIFFCVFDMSPNCYLRIVENKIIEMYMCLPLLYDKHVPLLRPLDLRPVLLLRPPVQHIWFYCIWVSL